MNINEFRNQFPDEDTCRQYLEKAIWHQGRICPHCNNKKIMAPFWCFHPKGTV